LLSSPVVVIVEVNTSRARSRLTIEPSLHASRTGSEVFEELEKRGVFPMSATDMIQEHRNMYDAGFLVHFRAQIGFCHLLQGLRTVGGRRLEPCW